MIGTTVSHYTILEKIGEGGMGVVYKARDTRLDRCVALKFLPPESTRDEQAKRRFIREAKAASALDHPNIGVIHDIDETPEGNLFICMACYDGATLPSPGEDRTFGPEEALRITLQIARGLEQAHAAGITHRDIKPANVMITSHGEAKILDFGLAKLSHDGISGSTQTTGGTAAYMSPEQVTGDPVDHRSDLFSLGILFYELLTGARAFEGQQQQAVMYSIVHAEPKPPSELIRDLPRGYDRLVLGLLQKEPRHRYQTAAAFCDDATALLEDRPLVIAPRIRSPRRMKKRLAVAGGVISIAATVYILMILPGTWDTTAKSVTVMKFTSPEGDTDLERISNGLSVNIRDKLAKLREDDGKLLVSNSDESSDTTIRSALDLPGRLGTQYAVTGHVGMQGEMLYVSVRLLWASTHEELSAQDFVRNISSRQQLETDIVFKIGEWLEIPVSAETKKRLAAGSTTDDDAYEKYANARGFLLDYDLTDNIIAAIRLLEQAIALDSSFVLAHAALAEAYLRRFDAEKQTQWLDAARSAADRAIATGSEFAESHMAEGMVLSKQGEYIQSILSFERARGKLPRLTPAIIGQANAYAKLNETTDAIASYREAILMDPDYWGNYQSFGVFYLHLRKPEEAAEQFKALLERAPDNIKGLNNMGTVYFQYSRFEEAEPYYRRSIEVEPNYRAYSNLATCYFRQGKFAEAVPIFKAALFLRTNDGQMWGNYAESLRWSDGDTAVRSEAYRTAIDISEKQLAVNRKDAELLYRLAGYHTQLGDSSQARSYLIDSEELSQQDGYALSRIAIVYEELGERAKVLALCVQAIEQGSDLKEVEESFAMEDLRDSEEYRDLKVRYGLKYRE